MKKAVHFGAGNIGRGFIGEILNKNGFEITFVDMNASVIDALNERHAYEIGLASPEHEKIEITNVQGINNGQDPQQVVKAIAEADLVTTAIGPNILPYIAELIAQGIQGRRTSGKQSPLDFLACENMIGGSEFIYQMKIKTMCHSTLDFPMLQLIVSFPANTIPMYSTWK